MAKIVLGIGSSHTPLLTLTPEQWQHRAAVDYANTELNMSDGRLLIYAQVLDALTSGNHEGLRSITRGALNSGSSEILNWIVTAGAVHALPLRWKEYFPLYRTPAGTGVGAAFAVWGNA